jgi:hypothetical protein
MPLERLVDKLVIAALFALIATGFSFILYFYVYLFSFGQLRVAALIYVGAGMLVLAILIAIASLLTWVGGYAIVLAIYLNCRAEKRRIAFDERRSHQAS